jgi:hypothetical protein
MKRISRKPAKFGPFELFVSLAPLNGFTLKNPDTEAFKEKVTEHLKGALANEALIHGKRTEAMFAYAIAGLGKCMLIKQEDAGSTFARVENLAVPDYRLVTDDGRVLLVEVKNFRQKRIDQAFQIKNEYLECLSDYAKINQADLRVAIYFSRFREWMLVPAGAFSKGDIWSRIDFGSASMANEMAVLGDRMVATVPPLALEFIASAPNAAEALKVEGAVDLTMTIQEVLVKCAGQVISDKTQRNLAFFFMCYGGWSEVTSPLRLVDTDIVAFEFRYEPAEPVDEQPFQFLASLSGMMSRVFLENTGDARVDLDADPLNLDATLSTAYRSSDLPVWQFVLTPSSRSSR